MQRPRRTSEFQDDTGCMKRQSRASQRTSSDPSPSAVCGMVAACAGGTAKKYFTRQSRIAVPSRTSSSDRGSSINPYLTASSSAIKRGVTPQKTPHPKPITSRVLFTAEKQRTGQGFNTNPVALHNDKKWVQEQTQRITEHLLGQNTLGGGISTDFLHRGLRQMSIKQFVAIINYFLGYIWGNRFTVGTNYVEDIINILQKLHYPHPLNKSWLKTPNTQHSFGNVIVLLDFLMDFVPTEEKNGDGMYFDLKEPGKPVGSINNQDPHCIPDLEFQQELLKNSEKGFSLWDKQKKEEFDSLQLDTCNLLIRKMWGVADLESVKQEIKNLQEILKALQNETLPKDKEMLKTKSNLTHDIKSMHRDIKTLEDECDVIERKIEELVSLKMSTAREVELIEKDIKSLQDILHTQSCTVDHRDKMIADVMQHKQMLAIKERTIQDLQTRYHNEQIAQSKALKQLNDQVEQFNDLMREIKFSDLVRFRNTSLKEDNLELSLRPEQTDLDKIMPLLQEINKIATRCVHENKEKIFHVQERCKLLANDIDVNLQPKLNSLRSVNTNNLADFQKLVHSHKVEEFKLQESIQKLESELDTAEKIIKELQIEIKNKETLTEELSQKNEQTMQQAEEQHRQSVEERRTFLNAYEKVLDECMQGDTLKQLIEQVELQDKQLAELEKLFNN